MTDDLIGRRFHRWQVLAFASNKDRKLYYLCRCRCGTEKPVRKDQLQRGISKSCGCLKNEIAATRFRKMNTTHGKANKSRTYSIWKGIRKRCNNPNARVYQNYGAKGIKVCKRWSDYAMFLQDMGEAPQGTSIDRIDNSRGYEPSNCRWADAKTQMNNMSTNLLYQFHGETMTLKQWCEKLNVPYHRIWQRVFRLGWPAAKALGIQ